MVGVAAELSNLLGLLPFLVVCSEGCNLEEAWTEEVNDHDARVDNVGQCSMERVYDMTPPPPPLSAQYRSWFSELEAIINSPEGVTTSKDSALSAARPKIELKAECPPPWV
ncbi:hypothetical protein BN1723_008867 [Verticillium longisporum]|uniref:Uncharacterized protein n=1 Tax=Verticillium longisporum TaxID=100787 RepID=A0A0G4KJC0_VERLO|nr:hypothetical protein BN1723_008867 [Verticillium longisporum]